MGDHHMLSDEAVQRHHNHALEISIIICIYNIETISICKVMEFYERIIMTHKN